jgi:hypothetical protein
MKKLVRATAPLWHFSANQDIQHAIGIGGDVRRLIPGNPVGHANKNCKTELSLPIGTGRDGARDLLGPIAPSFALRKLIVRKKVLPSIASCVRNLVRSPA